MKILKLFFSRVYLPGQRSLSQVSENMCQDSSHQFTITELFAEPVRRNTGLER